MSATGSCPNCGSTLAPGAINCARCGYQLREPAPLEAAPAGPPIEKASSESPPSFDFGQTYGELRQRASREFSELKARWRVENQTVFLAALAMAALSFIIARIAGPSFVNDADSDSAVWLQLALGLALGAAALAVYIRWESGPPRESAESEIDYIVGGVLAGITMIFALLCVFKGFDGSIGGVDAWFRYAFVYAVLVVAIFAIARPTPRMVRTTASTTVGLTAVGLAAGALVLGQIFGLSNNVDTFATGVSFQYFGLILMVLSLGWFLGLKAER